jgi:CheY-like chemotaxis protein
VVLFPARRAPRGDGEAGGAPAVPTLGDLRHAKVLLVEDDFIVAYDMQTMLEEQGANVIGPASSLSEARELLARNGANVAVLDVNLNGELVFPLAEELQSRGVPYVFATAYADDERLYPPSAQQAPRLAKPVLPAVLIAQVARLLK